MAKKKKKKTASPAPPKEQAFNSPFAALGKELKKTAKPQAAPAEPPTPKKKEDAPEDEQALFSMAMSGVDQLPGDQRPVPKAPPPNPANLGQAVDEELEVMAHLAELISGSGDFDLRMSDEYVSGQATGVGPELMERLAQGAFPIQDHLDLHGLGLSDAQGEVADFVDSAVARGFRHVLLVHGRGKGSPGGVPVLKQGLAAWLEHKRFARKVLAFCTARPIDGGAGAMYLLLRKWSGPKGRKW
ncbi:MAG: Smr/MutS family protein [Desulfarculaceae bacterium]|nr:Smr/MutS family protein [Desulfarculaceae bacterium]MCF8047685.1 Smr/MutS family protein [Desulfarculaceae bacterium]MCF8099141.1 Smr/MutS family protein [Desulfarculaceae bacterium]MCF8121711.1 Smr/MutS family protein [Desulfarculaceae bacterium]